MAKLHWQSRYNSLKTHWLCLLISMATLLPSLAFAEQDGRKIYDEIMQATDRREAGHFIFQRALSGNDPELQKAALLGLGRIGAAKSIDQIGTYLYSPQPDIRKTAAFSLAITMNPNAYNWLVKRLASETNHGVLAELVAGIGIAPKHESDPDRVAVLLPYLDHAAISVRASTCDGLNYAWSMYRDTISVPNSTQVFKLMSMAQAHPELADHCLYSLTRLRTETALFEQAQLLKTIAAASTPYHHKLLLLIVGQQQNVQYLPYITAQLNAEDMGVVAEAATALAKLPLSEANNLSYQALLKHPESQVKIGFIQGLVSQPPSDSSLAMLKQLSEDSSNWIKYRALALLFQAQPENYLSAVLKLFEQSTAQSTTWELMLLEVAGQMDDDAAKAVIKRALKSDQTVIREIAEQLATETSDDAETRPNSATAPYAAVRGIFSERLVIQTNRGDITIQLLPAAPYSSFNFYQLAAKGYYDGTPFHRVIPNFVAQGGDARGTGTGNPGYVIREELSPSSQLRGTVGVATSGKDTGGSQFYFNLKDNWHLDRRYTVFARVTEGMDVMDKLERGDYVISVKPSK